MNYYAVWSSNAEGAGVGRISREVDCFLTVRDACRSKLKIGFNVSQGELLDLLPNELSWCVVSRIVKLVFDAFKLPGDTFEWFPVGVRTNDTTALYYTLWCPMARDVVNRRRRAFRIGESTYFQKSFLDAGALEKMTIAAIDEHPDCLVVAEEVKAALENSKCTGFSFEKIEVAGAVKRRPRRIDIGKLLSFVGARADETVLNSYAA
jgi:hypothetical protein